MGTRAHSLKKVDDSVVTLNGPIFDDGVAALYAENGSVARAIMEWRHKVVTLYVLTLGAAGSCWLWLYDHHGEDKLPLVCYAVAVVAAIVGVMDGTNAAILKACYRVGAQIEQRVTTGGGIFTALHIRSQHPRTFTYTRILRVLYFGTSVLFVVAGTVLRIRAIH